MKWFGTFAVFLAFGIFFEVEIFDQTASCSFFLISSSSDKSFKLDANEKYSRENRVTMKK